MTWIRSWGLLCKSWKRYCDTCTAIKAAISGRMIEIYLILERNDRSMEKIWERLIVRHREMVSYVFWGAVTTLVNYAVYFICTKLCSIHYLVSNIIAWVIAMIFA